MCKKIGIAAIAVVLGLVVLNKTKLGDWAKFGYQRAKEAISSSIPPEMEIAKLKNDLAQFEPRMKEHLNKIAEAKTAMQSLEKDIDQHTARLEDQKERVLRLRKDADTVKVDGSKKVQQATLEREWKRYRTGEEGLKAKQMKLEARRTKFAAAIEELESMKTMRLELEGQIEDLEARLETIRATEAADPFSFSDPLMGDIKEGIVKLNTRLSNDENFKELSAKYLPSSEEKGSTKKATVSDDLLKEIDDHFKPAKTGSKVASDRE
jgi:chromosome segregation ATPase